MQISPEQRALDDAAWEKFMSNAKWVNYSERHIDPVDTALMNGIGHYLGGKNSGAEETVAAANNNDLVTSLGRKLGAEIFGSNDKKVK